MLSGEKDDNFVDNV